MKLPHMLGIGGLIVAGFFVFSVLPYYASGQNNLDLSALSGDYDPAVAEGFFHGQTIASPFDTRPIANNTSNVLGAYRGDKRIEVDLTNQRIYAFEGDTKVMDYLISSGKWGRTPTGEFTIWTKLRYTRMSGGNKALGTYYNLPNVPYTMFFSNAQIPSWRGYGIHGTYWHSNFGHPMSHGCINMKTEEVEKLYYWAQPDLPDGKSSIRTTPDNQGTRIIIYGKAPTT